VKREGIRFGTTLSQMVFRGPPPGLLVYCGAEAGPRVHRSGPGPGSMLPDIAIENLKRYHGKPGDEDGPLP
jgi:hypothetical protein